MLAPAVLYLFTGWVTRRDRIKSLLTPEYLDKYFSLFPPLVLKDHPRRDNNKNLDDRITTTCGRKQYVLPLMLLGVVTAVGLWLTGQAVIAWTTPSANIKAMPGIVIAAFLGAYVWVTQDLLARFRTMDFTFHDVWAAVFRFLLSLPLAYSLVAILKEEVAVPIAFLLGAFPTKLLITIARRMAAARLGFGESADTGQSELLQLQSVSKSHAERFEDEGYLSVAQLAWADPVDVTLRTNLNFYFVFDCQNQALLWVYLGSRVKKVYKYSLRGAQEVTYLVERFRSKDMETQKAAARDFAGAAKALDMEVDALYGTLSEVRDDPYTKFLCSLWPEKVGHA
jgi:hypothetical protein